MKKKEKMGIIILLTGRILYITKTENRLKQLEKKKKKIINLLITLQENFFNNHLIDAGMYKTYLENYHLGEYFELVTGFDVEQYEYYGGYYGINASRLLEDFGDKTPNEIADMIQSKIGEFFEDQKPSYHEGSSSQ